MANGGPHGDLPGNPEAALLQLKTMIQMGFAENQRRLASLENKAAAQAAGCPACHDGLVQMISDASAEGRRVVKEAVKEVVAEFLAKHRDHEDRIRGLERGAWKLAGVGALAGVLGGAILTGLGRLAIERIFG